MIAYGPRFTYKKADVTTALVDIDVSRMQQSTGTNGLKNKTGQGRCIEYGFKFEFQQPEKSRAIVADWENSSNLKKEEFARAISLALFDDLRKSRSHGFIVSLSGGANSSAVACLVALMMRLACKEIGVENVVNRIRLTNLDLRDENKIVKSLLTCVYQATENSSEGTRNAASTLANAIGTEYMEFDVNDLVKGYVSMIEDQMGRELNWQQDDIVLRTSKPGSALRECGCWQI